MQVSKQTDCLPWTVHDSQAGKNVNLDGVLHWEVRDSEGYLVMSFMHEEEAVVTADAMNTYVRKPSDSEDIQKQLDVMDAKDEGVSLLLFGDDSG